MSDVKKLVRLDIGCGKNKKDGFLGVDQYAMEGVDVVHDLTKIPWPFLDNSVDEVYSSHFLEHLKAEHRVRFMNELYRIMKLGAKAEIITPHWCNARAYGDFTHQWPAVSEIFYMYLSRDWRMTDAPHTDKKWNSNGFDCNFSNVMGYSYKEELAAYSKEDRKYALSHYKDAVRDLHVTIKKEL